MTIEEIAILENPFVQKQRATILAYRKKFVALEEINADLLEALTLWKAADEEPHEDARQVMRGLAREKRNAAISRAETPDTGADHG